MSIPAAIRSLADRLGTDGRGEFDPEQLAVLSSDEGQVVLAVDEYGIPLDPADAEFLGDRLQEAASAARDR